MSTTTVAILLYIFTRLDMIHGMAMATSFVLGCYILVGSLVFLLEMNTWNEWEGFKKSLKPAVAVLVVGLSIVLFVPTSKDAALIIGGTLGYEAVSTIVSDDRVQQIGGKTYEALDTWLDEQAEKGDE